MRARSTPSTIVLREVVEADLPIFFEHQRDPEAHRMAAFAPRDRDAFMTHWHTNILANRSGLARTIVADREVVGHVVSWGPDEDRQIGYWLGRDHWGRGVTTAAVREFLDHHEPRRPLLAHVAAANVGSIRVLEKCHFDRRGQATTSPDGVTEFEMVLAR